MPEKNINLIAIQDTHILTCTYFSYLKHSSKNYHCKTKSFDGKSVTGITLQNFRYADMHEKVGVHCLFPGDQEVNFNLSLPLP